jgi:hypothetical protein
MQPITDHDIHTAIEGFEHYHGQLVTDATAYHVAAAAVIMRCLSPEWAHRLAMGKDGSTPFSGMVEGDLLNAHRSAHQLIKLAEMLINFQAVEGFYKRMKDLVDRPDVEATVAELQGAELLFRSGIPFRFVTEVMKKGSDYDLEAMLGGNPVACEIKCNVQDTKLNASSIKTALNKAREQLPTDKPAIVFLRIPEPWVRDVAVDAEFKKALADVLGRTGRISAVVIRWTEAYATPHDAGSAVVKERFRTEHNPKARYSLAEFGHIILSPLRTDLWRTIPDIVARRAL